MAIAYNDRCTANSWRGTTPAPPKNRCILHEPSRTPHEVHRDEHGNNFIIANGVSYVVDKHGKKIG